MKSIKKDNKGFSLVEVLVSMAILAIILTPLLNNFVMASRMNNRARKMQQATNLGQNVMEGIKASKNLEEIAKQFNYPTSGFDIIYKDATTTVSELSYDAATSKFSTILESERTYLIPADPLSTESPFHEKLNTATDPAVYYFGIAGIKEGKSSYDALITLDGTTNYKTTGIPVPGVTKTNDFEMPVLSDISRTENAIITQTFQDSWASDTLYSNYITYRAEQLASNPSAVPLPRYTSKAPIEETMTRNINITIDYDSINHNYNVKCDFVYTTDKIPTGTSKTVTYHLLDKSIGNKLSNIYLFFDPNLRSTLATVYDNITINNSSLAKVNIYLVEQARVKASYGSTYDTKLASYYLRTNINEDALPGFSAVVASNIATDKIHFLESGTPAIAANADSLITHNAETRIYDVKVELFKAAADESDRYLSSNLLATLETTKGE